MADNINPLTEDHLLQLNAALAKADVAQKQINMAKAAGLPVDQQQKDLDAAVTQIRQIKQVYFPGR